MFIVIVFGVLLIIGVAYVYKKVKAFKASTAYEKLEEAFNKAEEAEKAKDEADKVFWEAKEALEATPQWKAYEEALRACQKMHIAYVEADSDLRKVKRFAKSTLKEEMDEEAW